MAGEKDLEHIVSLLQVQNQQLQSILIQKQAMTMQKAEIEKALENLEKCGDDIYKSLGPILVKADKEETKKELEENAEDIGIKLQTLDRQEKKLKDKLKEAQEKFREMIPPQEEVGQGG